MATRELRRLTSQRAALIVERTRIRNQIRGHLLVEPRISRLWASDGMTWLAHVVLPQHERAILDCDLALLDAVAAQLAKLDRNLAERAYVRIRSVC